MKIKEYTEICKQFADDTKEWAGLTGGFYMTYKGEWYESCDACHGGIDVSWAFHMSADKIEAMAPQMMMDSLTNLMEQANDEDWPADVIEEVLEDYR